jgi:peptidoglycan/xylan/chitin deacetylase (PgdA/CDA1 family)
MHKSESEDLLRFSASIVNLTVHGIGPVDRDLAPDEDSTWVSVEQFEQVLDAVVGCPDVRLTFDDGNASDREIALPRLLERGLTAEFFVLAGLLGEPGRLRVEDVRELMACGMAIGSHGWAHRDWRRMDVRQWIEEITEANQVIGEATGQRVSRVAIPFGSYDRHVLRRLRRAGLARVYTSDGGRAEPHWWLQPRTSLRRDLDGTWIAGVLNGPPTVPARARKLAARTIKRLRGRP